MTKTYATALAHGLRRCAPITVDEHTFAFDDFGELEYTTQIRMPIFFRHTENGQRYRVIIEPVDSKLGDNTIERDAHGFPVRDEDWIF